jgi:L-alanine-DL-glutamate epimerase-like enolase superfamily enzyme
MRITDIQAFLLSSPMPQPICLTYYGGERVIFKRDAAMVKITTDGGLVGYGPAVASERAVAHINGVICDALIGEDPTQTESLRTKTLRGASGAVALAFGGVEIALYDLRGKIEGCSVHTLLGGKVRDRIRLYGSAGMYQSPERYAAEAAAVAALGFTAYKMRPALGPEDDLKTVRLMREAVGADVGIMVDAHAWWRMGDRSYSPELIEQLAREMAIYNIAWLEEPLPPKDRAAYVRLREAGIVPIAAGEHETSLDGFMEIIKGGGVDVAQSDVAHQGGYTAVKQVIQTCGEHGRQFAFHNWGTLLECLAMAHLGVCFPADVCAWLEYPCFSHRGQDIMYPYPLADDILKEPLRIEHGDLIISDAPGLGVEVDESVIDRYPYIPGPWSVFRLTSPPEEWALSGDHAAEWEEK